MRSGGLVAFLAFGCSFARAQYCNGRELYGPYAMHLAGSNTISGTRKPAVVLARIVFAADGVASGYASVNFGGLLLGNPVTGTFEIAPDCTLKLNLQDDSGGWQHFRGSLRGGAQRLEIRQSDPETDQAGVLERTSGSCNAADLRSGYEFALSSAASNKGVLRIDSRGRLSITWDPATRDARTVGATANVQSDCFVELEFTPPSGGNPIHLRGMLANGGREIVTIATDPGETVWARFVAR